MFELLRFRERVNFHAAHRVTTSYVKYYQSYFRWWKKNEKTREKREKETMNLRAHCAVVARDFTSTARIPDRDKSYEFDVREAAFAREKRRDGKRHESVSPRENTKSRYTHCPIGNYANLSDLLSNVGMRMSRFPHLPDSLDSRTCLRTCTFASDSRASGFPY